MGEKASIFQTIQVGVETTPGTAVPANKKLTSLSMVPQPQAETDAFRAAGDKYSSFATLNKEWSSIDIDGKPTFNEIVYLLASLLHYTAPAQQGSTTAYKWTFGSNTSSEDIGKTFTIEQGDANSAWRIKGVRVSGATFNFSRNGITVKGNGIGEQFEKGITMTANPTKLAPVPMLPTQMSFYMADTQAGLAGATAMTRSFSMEWALTDKFGLAWPVGQPPYAVEGEPKNSAKLKLATDNYGMSFVDFLRNAVTKWFRVKIVGGLIDTGYNHSFQLDFPAQVNALSNLSDLDGVYVAEFGLLPIHDATWGKAMNIEVITNLASL